MEVRRLDAPLGAEVRGVAIDAPLDEATVAALRRLLAEHIVLRFHESEQLDPAALVGFGAHFGPFRLSVADESRVAGHPEINLVSNVREDGRLIGTGGDGVIEWHSDLGFDGPLTQYIVLDAVELPAGGGGNTRYTNLRLAYDALDDATKRRIENVKVRYSLRSDLGYVRASEEHLATLQAVTHALVQVDRITGARSVWPNVGIFEATVIEGDAGTELLRELFDHCTEDRFVYDHEWETGDLLIWDNVATMHRREPFDPTSRRVMRHLTVTRD
jgi:taurine dioxygenase